VLVYVRQYQNEVLVCVANLSRSAQAAEIDLSPWRGRIPLELLGRTNFPPIGDNPYLITLAPYGFFWFQLCETGGPDATVTGSPPEFETLVITVGWRSLLQADRDRSGARRASRLSCRPSLVRRTRQSVDFDSIIGTMPRATVDPELGLLIEKGPHGCKLTSCRSPPDGRALTVGDK
jgi:hypothetical protein